MDPARPHTCPRCGTLMADFAHMAWTCNKVAQYWAQVFADLSHMTGLRISTTPIQALLGHVQDLPKSSRRFCALALLLAKREVALHWGSKNPPTLKGWMFSMSFCNTTSDLYAQLQPPASRTLDVWQPFRSYLLAQTFVSSKRNKTPQLKYNQKICIDLPNIMHIVSLIGGLTFFFSLT